MIELQGKATWNFGPLTFTGIIMTANTTSTSWCTKSVIILLALLWSNRDAVPFIQDPSPTKIQHLLLQLSTDNVSATLLALPLLDRPRMQLRTPLRQRLIQLGSSMSLMVLLSSNKNSRIIVVVGGNISSDLME